MSDELELDQEDTAARLAADGYFSDISVLLQRKGVTESDIEVALSVLNEKTGKIGACAVVLMPTLIPEPAGGAPTPLYGVRQTVQVIEHPLFNLSDTGTGKSAESIALRIRQLCHQFSTGRIGASHLFAFDGMEPIPQADGKVSYGVAFRRKAGDPLLVRTARVGIASDSAAAPATVTLTPPASAEAWFTVDGSYPSPVNEAARKYAAPFAVAEAGTIRAVALIDGQQQSNVSELTLI